MSLSILYKEARSKDNTITLKMVKDWYEKDVKKTRNSGSKHCSVAKSPFYEFQIDLFFITGLDNQWYNMGLCCVDTFSKFAAVLAIRSDDYLAGLMECMEKMVDTETISNDDEGALNSNVLLDYLGKHGVEKLTTRGHAHFAERFIRTFKFMLYKRN